MSGVTYNVSCPCGDLFVTVNDDEAGNIFEVFITLGKAGGCGAATTAAVGVLLSVGIRSGVSPEELVVKLNGIQCFKSSKDVPSCVTYVAQIIKEHEENKRGE